MALDAVKEAFMEVGAEAPEDCQGWRMFSEIIQQDDLAVSQNPRINPAISGAAVSA